MPCVRSRRLACGVLISRLAKAAGMLDTEKDEERPSIVGINMRGPDQALSPGYTQYNEELDEQSTES
jgi:hypothetical protein